MGKTNSMTTKYELTDADRKRLDAIAQRANGKPKVDDIAWKIACDWFATLPVVPREAAERALGEATTEECILYRLTEEDADYDWTRAGLNAVLARRRDMLDDAMAEPPKAEPTPEPQPAIDVVAELAEIRDDILAIRRTIKSMLETQNKHQDAMNASARRRDLQGEWVENLKLRVAALESAAQRRPWWRWW